VSISSNHCCEDVEENIRLKAKLEKGLANANQKSNACKEGLGSVAKPKNNNNNNNKRKKKKNAAHNREARTFGQGGDGISGQGGISGQRRGGNSGPTSCGYAGANKPSFVLFHDYYGQVCARYVGPYHGYVAWSIWVPKTLLTNNQGPIAQWVPKNKN
jgi:hypothetical protein